MITFDEFLKKYAFYKKGCPCLDFVTEIKEGDLLKKGHGLSYVIDSLSSVDKLNNLTETFDFQATHDSFSGKTEDVKMLFGKNKTIPFSEAFKQKIGECMEKSVATYLLLRNSKDLENQLIINGGATDNLDQGFVQHTYNVVKKQNDWYLLDAQNPISINKFEPYIAKILGVELKLALPLKLEETIKTNRIYSLGY
jgi:hypothetical protein